MVWVSAMGERVIQLRVLETAFVMRGGQGKERLLPAGMLTGTCASPFSVCDRG